MKALQSYWFQPFGELRSSRYRGGFPTPKHFWISTALSCLLARKTFGEVEFYTDSFGASLIEKLRIPYDKVHNSFDKLPPVPSFMWSFAKISLCASQETSFVHLDSDLFLFKPPSPQFLQAELMVQSIEYGSYHEKFYSPAAVELSEHFCLPQSIQDYLSGNRPFLALNCGIIGGRSEKLISSTFQKSADIISNPSHQSIWKTLEHRTIEDREAFNCVLEQQALAYAAEDTKISPVPLLDLGPNKHAPFNDPDFLHLIGNSKFEARYLKRVEDKLEEIDSLLLKHIRESF